jgi:hypothetical protein
VLRTVRYRTFGSAVRNISLSIVWPKSGSSSCLDVGPGRIRDPVVTCLRPADYPVPRCFRLAFRLADLSAACSLGSSSSMTHVKVRSSSGLDGWYGSHTNVDISGQSTRHLGRILSRPSSVFSALRPTTTAIFTAFSNSCEMDTVHNCAFQ